MVKIKNRAPEWLFLMVLLCISADSVKLMKVKVNDDLTVSVPRDWKPMDDLDITQRYPSVRAPLAAYTNMEREADFSINISATQWPDDDVTLAQKFFKAGLMNTFDKVEVIKEGINEVRGKKFIFFEFESRVNGTRQEGMRDPVQRYTYIQYLIQPGKALVFTFSCPKRDREQWQETAHDMMTAIKIK